MDRPAHNAKSPAKSLLDLRNDASIAAWRERLALFQAGYYTTRDLRTVRARNKAEAHFARELHSAGIFLAVNTAKRRDEEEQRLQRQIEVAGRRALMRVVQGGRP